MSQQTTQEINQQKDETSYRALRNKPKSAAKSTRLYANINELSNVLGSSAQKPSEPARKNPHRRTPGKTNFADLVGPTSPQVSNQNTSKQKASIYSYDQAKALFYTPLFSDKKKSSLATPNTAKKTSQQQQNKLRQTEIKNQFYQRQMQSYYEKRGGIFKSSFVSEKQPVMSYMKEQPKHDLSPATYSPKKEVVMFSYPEWTIGEKQYQETFKEQVPGPGSYDAAKQFGADAVAVKIRDPSSPDRENSVPGPGTYDQSINQIKPRAPAWELGARHQTTSGNNSPGPGHYQPDQQFAENSIKYSIAVRREDPLQNVPGPGSYEPVRAESLTKISSREVQILPEHQNSQQFSHQQNNPDVAPGTYNPSKPFGSDSVSVLIQQRRESPLKYTVGPGAYDPVKADQLVKVTAPIYTHGIRRNSPSEVDQERIGPGHYNPTKPFGYDAKSFVYSDIKDSLQAITAGPGEYSHERADSLTKPSSRKVEIMPYTKTMLQITDVPGPGYYNYADEFGANLNKSTFGIRREQNTDSLIGPGHYSPEKADKQTFQHAREVDFGSMPKRVYTEDEMALGPGSYNPEPKFGDDARDMTIGLPRRQSPDNKVPGPGFYNPERAEGLVKPNADVSLVNFNGQQRFSNAEMQNLGPGSYEVHNNFGDQVQGGHMFDKRDEKIPVAPGPGTYSPEKADQLIFQRAAATDFSKQPERPNQTEDGFVGPGAYDQIQNFGEHMNRATIGVRRDEPVILTPGPGSYSPERADSQIMTQAAAADFSKQAERVNKLELNQIGPGQYEIKEQFGSKMNQITFGVRREETILPSPGPGTYSPERGDHLVLERYAAYDFAKQTERKESTFESLIGPGSYKAGFNFGEDLNKVTIGVRREDSISQTPGPGTYSPEKADAVTYQRASAADFAKQTERPGELESSQLGPGQYALCDDFGNNMNKITIGVRREERPINTPGPGTYSPEKADHVVLEKYAAYDFGKQTERQNSIQEGLTGPGSYKTIGNFGEDLNKVTIGVRREDSISQTPGPGTYSPEKADHVVLEKYAAYDFSKQTERQDLLKESIIGPGAYQTSENFGQSLNKITIGVRREDSIAQTPGPGYYSPERGDKQVFVRASDCSFKDQTGRKDFLSDSQIGPGSYANQADFLEQAGKVTIGVRRENKIEVTAGPGSYQIEKGDLLVYTRASELNFEKQSPRKDKLVSDSHLGPGMYNHASSFDHLPVMTIQERRLSKTIVTPGPTDYSPEKADPLTKLRDRTPDFSKSSARKSFMPESNLLGPGHYDAVKSFIDCVGNMTIAERRKEKYDSNLGPGYYSPERSESVVKSSSRKVNFLSSPGRKTKLEASNIGPGSYNNASSFNNLPMMTIQQKRDSKTSVSPGPGQYNIETAEKLTKVSSVSAKITARKVGLNEKADPNNGPGTYEVAFTFGKDSKKMTIGARQDHKIQMSAGPGSYNLEKADQLVKKSAKKPDFSKSSPRRNKQASADLGPGFYNTIQNFGSGSPAVIIAGKQSDKKIVTVGPGSYDPIDSVTKQRTPVAVIPKSPARFRPQIVNQGVQNLGELPDFTHGSKPFTIGVRRTESNSNKLGPGQYNPKDELVKARPSSAVISESPPRFVGGERATENVSFGEGDLPNFTDGSKGFTIGVRRPAQKQDDFPGPGFYDPAIADKITKASSPSRSISKQSSISASRSSINQFKRKKSVGFLHNNMNLSFHTLNNSKSVSRLNKSVLAESKSNGVLKASKPKKPSSAFSFVKTKALLHKSPQTGKYDLVKSNSPVKQPAIIQSRKSEKQDKAPGEVVERSKDREINLQMKNINVYQKNTRVASKQN